MSSNAIVEDGNRYRLRELKIEVTQACRLSCIHCSSSASAIGYKEMELEAAKSIVRQSADMGVAEIAISGGEPLVWSGIDELLELCHRLEMHTTVPTSGNEVFHAFSKSGSSQVRENRAWQYRDISLWSTSTSGVTETTSDYAVLAGS
jgi:MoaA/NifB/PqqE/SkfB family radical SAM enzyme